MSGPYGVGQRLMERAAIVAFAALAAWNLGRLALATQAYFPAVALAATAAGWLACDLLSGLLHWTCDSLGSATTPFVGRALIRPFREHHADPEAMTHHDFVETHGASCLAALPLLVAASGLDPQGWPAAAGHALLVFTALGALATNQCHKWAHLPASATPRAVRWAQRCGLVLPREHHGRHHRPPFNTHYCMSNGWMNPLCDALLRRWR